MRGSRSLLGLGLGLGYGLKLGFGISSDTIFYPSRPPLLLFLVNDFLGGRRRRRDATEASLWARDTLLLWHTGSGRIPNTWLVTVSGAVGCDGRELRDRHVRWYSSVTSVNGWARVRFTIRNHIKWKPNQLIRRPPICGCLGPNQHMGLCLFGSCRNQCKCWSHV